MGINTKQTSPKITTLAVKTMNSKTASQIAKSLGASALAQTNTNKQTSSKMEVIASKVLSSNKYNKNTKALAGTVLSQANKERKV
jgi:hypothetical protein